MRVLPCMQIFVGSMEAPLLFSPFVCAASVRCCTLAGWVAPTSPPAPSLGPQPTHSRDILLPKTHPHRSAIHQFVSSGMAGTTQKAACAGAAGGRPAKARRAAACTRTNPGCAAPNAFWAVIHTFTNSRWRRWRPHRSVRPRLVASGLLPALPAPFGSWERSAMQLCTATSGHATLCCRSQKPGALGGLGAAAGACAGWIVNSAIQLTCQHALQAAAHPGGGGGGGRRSGGRAARPSEEQAGADCRRGHHALPRLGQRRGGVIVSRSIRDQLCPSIVVALARWQPALCRPSPVPAPSWLHSQPRWASPTITSARCPSPRRRSSRGAPPSSAPPV